MICGNITTNTSTVSSAMQKGNTPRNMVDKGTVFDRPRMTNTLIPIGGVIRASSTTITTTTPNQIGSKPNAVTMGKKNRDSQNNHRHGVQQSTQYNINQCDNHASHHWRQV